MQLETGSSSVRRRTLLTSDQLLELSDRRRLADVVFEQVGAEYDKIEAHTRRLEAGLRLVEVQRRLALISNANPKPKKEVVEMAVPKLATNNSICREAGVPEGGTRSAIQKEVKAIVGFSKAETPEQASLG